MVQRVDMNSNISITLEFTPNPNTLKFVTNETFLERGAANFTSLEKAQGSSPLAEKILQIPGIEGVMIGSSFITITKAFDGSWDIIAEEVPKTIESHLGDKLPIFTETYLAQLNAAKPSTNGNQSEIEQKIREILDTEIRPAVAMDGGDITFDRYDEGVVYLYLQGSCSSCPSSTATLKMGVETRLKEAIPEIKEVVQA